MSAGAANTNAKNDNLIYAGTCLVMILFSAGGLIYGFKSEMILAPDAPFTLDGILLALVCLSMGGLFTLMLAWHAVSQGWIKLPGKKAAAPDAKPAAEAK